MRPLTVALRTVTPLFLGGADANDHAELRAPSIKGLLRWWYRAIDPEYAKWESRIFGGTGRAEGQACVALRMVPPLVGREPWAGQDGERYRRPPHQEGNPHEPINGLAYLGYSLRRLGSNARKAIPAGARFDLVLRPTRSLDELRVRRGVIASLWLLGHLGAAGTRSRRGFGSLRLEGWDLGALADEARDLPLAASAATPQEWLDKVQAGLATLRRWFGAWPASPDHTVLGTGVKLLLFRDGHCARNGAQAWELALGAIGKELQVFRRRLPLTDYKLVKAHLAARHLQRHPADRAEVARALAGLPARFISSGDTIERAAFGLPLGFRYRSLKALDPKLSATFEGTQHDRSASRLHLRVVQLGQGCHALAIVTTAPLLAPGEELREQRRGGPPGARYAFRPPGRRLPDDFADRLKSKGVIEQVLP